MLEALMAPLLAILRDPSTTEVYSVDERLRAVRGGQRIWIDEVGLSAERLELIRRALAAQSGGDLTAMQTGDWRGYRWATGGPPASRPYLSLRRHLDQALSLQSYVDDGRANAAQIAWLNRPRSLILAGTTGSGKTTLLSAILNHPNWCGRRIVLVEDTAELVAPPDAQRIVTSDMRAGVAHALRLLPDLIVLGEVRGAAAFDAIMAALTGHDALVTVHAGSAAMAYARLQALAEQSGQRLARGMLREAFPTVMVLERGARIVELTHQDQSVG